MLQMKAISRQEHWVAQEETPGVELVKFGERFNGDVDANTELSLSNRSEGKCRDLTAST